MNVPKLQAHQLPKIPMRMPNCNLSGAKIFVETADRGNHPAKIKPVADKCTLIGDRGVPPRGLRRLHNNFLRILSSRIERDFVP